MHNMHIENFVDKGLIKMKEHSTLDLYNNALEGFVDSLIELELNGYKKILLYSAGEVAGMMVHALKNTDRLTMSL